MTVHKVYGLSVITALTAQNTLGVQDVLEIEPKFIEKQLNSVLTDIFPDAVKIGMILGKKTIELVAENLKEHNAKNIVIDTVMAATSGDKLVDAKSIDFVVKYLFPLATIVTPNIPEAEKLSGVKIASDGDMILAAKKIRQLTNAAILIKGGHLKTSADDLLFTQKEAVFLRGKRIANQNTHGTGCTMSAAIACNLALGDDVGKSVKYAKNYITDLLGSKLDLGKGIGPLEHTFKG